MLLGVDVGGTFTDAVLVRGDGSLASAKVASTPQDQSIGVLQALAAVLGDEDPRDVSRFAHGMTVATNALIERRGARTALLVTQGFTDIVELARQARPQLYRLCAAPPAPLVPPQLRFAVPERMTPEGPLQPLHEDAARALVQRVASAQPQAVAVVLLHSYAHPQHELMLGQLLSQALPLAHISLSHQLVGTFREYERAATTELDAALSPLLAGYLRQVERGARDARLPAPQIMQSSGGLTDAASAAAHAALTVLSGPAGGVGGALLLASRADQPNVLCLDMGGTSCDVCLALDGAVAETDRRTIDGRPLALPSLDIHTVGAGGGSIAWRDPGGALRVGPRSAGAQPGPACYGRGGSEPTVTDANVLLGRLPASAALAGGLRLDLDAAALAIGALARKLQLDPIACAQGIVEVAEVAMVSALRLVSVQRGIDPRPLALLAFGGAGPLHAASLADKLGIGRVLCPSSSGVLCALGLAAAAPRRDAARTVLIAQRDLDPRRLAQEREALEAHVCTALGEAASVRVQAELRYRGQSHELAVELPPQHRPAQLIESFAAAHQERYGYRDEAAEVELVTLRASAFGRAPRLELRPAGGDPPAPRRASAVVWEGRQLEASVLSGPLPAGAAIDGPAVCLLAEATLFVPPGWAGRADEHGTLVLDAKRRAPATGVPEPRAPVTPGDRTARPSRPAKDAASSMRPDPIELQVMTGALASVCEEMGGVLMRAAHSPNIKERRDCSTALFDADGEMIMQAEHIPVHLGSMADAVAAVLREQHQPGTPWILNDPFTGGTHLPDVTIITPSFATSDGEQQLLGFAVSRAHHSDVGGSTPGSMPADSVTLEQEGVVIPPQPLYAETIERLVAQMRGPSQRRADLRAQLAANELGARRLRKLAHQLGLQRLRAGTAAVLQYAERRMCSCIAALADGIYESGDVLEGSDGDIPLCLRATVAGERLTLDFAGTAPRQHGNLNCPLAVTRSACAFAIRVLTDPDIPPSTGALRPIEVLAPRGCLLNATPPAAVAAGNVETSSRVADLVLAAFGRALGQGTMNNLTLGSERFAYYETIGGGQGACLDADGPSAIHVAMSNTLNTPIEALERELPIRVTAYAVRRGSGGDGAHRGGDGVVRELQALAPMSFSLITERRRHAPPGAAGELPGKPGRNLLIPCDESGGAAGGTGRAATNIGPSAGETGPATGEAEPAASKAGPAAGGTGRAATNMGPSAGETGPATGEAEPAATATGGMPVAAAGTPLPPKATGTLAPRDRLRIETPGGGGFGPANPCREHES